MLHAMAPSRMGPDRQDTGTPAPLTAWRTHQEQLTGMMLELQANHVALKQLQDWYGVFVFTGGDVPSGRCDLVAADAYMARPFATDRICRGEVKRYRQLVAAAMEPGADVAAGPRSLPCRTELGIAFDRAFSEIKTLEAALESALTGLLNESEPLFPAPETDFKTARA